MLRHALERATHPSPEQITALLEYLEEHPELARGFPKLPAAKNRVKRQWEQLAPRLNAIGKSVKTWQQWTKYWADKKLAVRRKAALREAVLNSGSDPDLVVELSDVEEHILALASRGYPTSARDTSHSEIEIANTSTTETLMMDNSDQVVLLVSPAELVQEASPSPPSPAPCPSRSPSPPAPQAPRTRFRPAASPTYRYTGPKRRRGHSQTPTDPTRRSVFASLTEKFLSIEEQRLELERRNTSILETMANVASQLMERDFERERVFAQALQTVGDGLKLLAEALRKDEPIDQM